MRHALAAAICGAIAISATARATSARVTCPRPYGAPAASDAASVIEATKRLVPHEYARLTSMGHVAWRHFQIQALFSLSPTYVVRQPAPVYRRIARRLCGEAVTERSWAVILQFPDCQLPCSEDVAFLARERRGWRIWYSEFHRP